VSVFEVESEPIDNQWFLKGLWYRHPKTIQWQFDNENNLIKPAIVLHYDMFKEELIS